MCRSTSETYEALRLPNGPATHGRARNLAVSVYELTPSRQEQLELFASPKHAVSEAIGSVTAERNLEPRRHL